jgi:hypothetical protein
MKFIIEGMMKDGQHEFAAGCFLHALRARKKPATHGGLSIFNFLKKEPKLIKAQRLFSQWGPPQGRTFKILCQLTES